MLSGLQEKETERVWGGEMRRGRSVRPPYTLEDKEITSSGGIQGKYKTQG